MLRYVGLHAPSRLAAATMGFASFTHGMKGHPPGPAGAQSVPPSNRPDPPELLATEANPIDAPDSVVRPPIEAVLPPHQPAHMSKPQPAPASAAAGGGGGDGGGGGSNADGFVDVERFLGQQVRASCTIPATHGWRAHHGLCSTTAAMHRHGRAFPFPPTDLQTPKIFMTICKTEPTLLVPLREPARVCSWQQQPPGQQCEEPCRQVPSAAPARAGPGGPVGAFDLRTRCTRSSRETICVQAGRGEDPITMTTSCCSHSCSCAAAASSCAPPSCALLPGMVHGLLQAGPSLYAAEPWVLSAFRRPAVFKAENT